jgi:hypothetical protein
MSMLLGLLEELLPFVFYITRANKKFHESSVVSKDSETSLYATCEKLTEEELTTRLAEEHERGKSIDEKTIKFSVTISLALTILGSAGSVVLKSIESPNLSIVASLLIALSVIYTISGGLLALGALKTLPTYGFGTYYLSERKTLGKEIITVALISQEKINIVRHLRNEASYQCLRNGLVLLLVVLVIYAASPVSKRFESDAKGEIVEKVEKSSNKTIQPTQ